MDPVYNIRLWRACHSALGIHVAACPFPPRPLPVTRWLLGDWLSHHPQVCSSREVDELLAEIQKAQSLRDHMQAPAPQRPLWEVHQRDAGGRCWEPELRPSRRHAAGLTMLSRVSPVTQAWLPGPKKWVKRGPACSPHSSELPQPLLEGSWWISNWKKKMYFREKGHQASAHPST